MGTSSTLQSPLHPKTKVDAFDRWLLYATAARVGTLPEGIVVGDSPDLVNRIEANELRQTETPEAIAAEQAAEMEVRVAEATKAAEADVDRKVAAAVAKALAARDKDAKAKASKSGKGDA